MNMNPAYLDPPPSERKQYIPNIRPPKTEERRRYEENVHDKVKFQQELSS